MLISASSCRELKESIDSCRLTYCKGLFLSARWMVIEQVASKGLNVIILPDRDSAEYCASDLYSLTEGDIVFFYPTAERELKEAISNLHSGFRGLLQ
jgi:hypothetical protein